VYRRRRIAVAVAAVVALVALASGISLLTRAGDDPAATVATPAAPTPQLPSLADPTPVLAADAGGEPAPDPAVLSQLLGQALDDSRLGGPVNADVLDVATGQVLFDQGAADAVTPASTAKLATALAVELTVDPGLRLSTRVLAGAAPGEIVLVGGGDPTLTTTPTGGLYAGAARLPDLAAQVKAAAGRAVTTVTVDSSLFAGSTTAPGWGAGDAPSSYAAPITATMVNGGRVSPDDEGIRAARPDLAAGQALADALGVPGAVVREGTAPSGAVELGEVRSVPIDRLVEQMLELSDNVLAESLARQVALAAGQPASFEAAAAAVRTALAGAGLDVGSTSLVDGSGLSTSDRVTVRLLTGILRLAAGPPESPGRALLAGLPVAAYDGTLEERFGQSPARGLVRAKTGTLNGVSALAGLVQTVDGRLVVFAFVGNQVPIGGRYPAESALDEAATVLAGCGCR